MPTFIAACVPDRMGLDRIKRIAFSVLVIFYPLINYTKVYTQIAAYGRFFNEVTNCNIQSKSASSAR
jgi:hypothetical protein